MKWPSTGAVLGMAAIVLVLAMPSGLVAQDERDARGRESGKAAKRDPFLQGLLRLADTGDGAPSPEDGAGAPSGGKPITFTDLIQPTYFTIPGGGACPADQLADALPGEPEDEGPGAATPITFTDQIRPVEFPIPRGGECPADQLTDALPDEPPDDGAINFNDQIPPTHFEIPGSDGECPAGGRTAYAILNSTTVTNANRNTRLQVVIGEFPGITVVPSNPYQTGWVPDPSEMVPGGALAANEMDPELRIFVTSLGAVGASAIEVTAVSSDAEPLALAGGAVVLEPVTLTPEASARLAAERRELARRGQEATTTADAYCLEMLRELPTPGTVLRIASSELQQRYAPIRRVLDAAKQVRDLGQLVPDSDPEDYFHSIRQWSIWSMEEELDEAGFAQGFLEQTRKNFQNVGREWTDEVEQLVQRLIPNRWRDIQKVLEAAQASSIAPAE